MTDQILDVNAAFKAERQQQVANIRAGREADIASAAKMQVDFAQRVAEGKVRDNGDGTYTVTDPGSWDDGEVWQKQLVPNFGALVLPVTNLDESAGKVALYTREATWHGTEEIGSLVPEGVSDLMEVLRLASTDFEVIQQPALYRKPGASLPVLDDDQEEVGTLAERERLFGVVSEIPGAFVNVRTDTSAALGVVGGKYKPIQNYDAGAFLQDLVRNHGLVFESAGATFGGKHVFIGMRLPDDIDLDLGDNVRDTIIPFLTFLNSHDGTTAASVTVSPWRVACGNTEAFNLRDAVARWSTRHTVNAMREDKIKEAQRTLGLTVKYFSNFRVEEEALARTSLAVAEFEAVAAEIYPKPADDATDRIKRNWDDRTGVLLGMYGTQAAETGRTAYSAERVYTDYLDHVAPKRVKEDKMAAARATSIVEGDDLGIKSRVHARLMALANG